MAAEYILLPFFLLFVSCLHLMQFSSFLQKITFLTLILLLGEIYILLQIGYMCQRKPLLEIKHKNIHNERQNKNADAKCFLNDY